MKKWSPHNAPTPWTPPGFWKYPPPRAVLRVESTPKILAQRLLLLASLAATPLLFLVMKHHAADRDALLASGVTTGAIITGLDSRGDQPASVSYVYTVNGADYRMNSTVPANQVASRSAGDYLPVTYLPAQPKLHYVGPKDRYVQQTASDNGFGNHFLATLPELVAALLLLNEWLRIQKRQLARLGKVTPGVLLHQKRPLLTHQLTFEFQDDQGHLARHTATVLRLPEIMSDNSLLIIYPPDHPHRALPLDTVRAAYSARET